MKKQSVFLLALLFLPLISAIPQCTASDSVETWVVLVAGYDTSPELSSSQRYEFLRDTYYAYYVFAHHYNIYDTPENEHIKYYYCNYPIEYEEGTVDGFSHNDTVRSAMAWLSTVSDSNDNVFIYFACHGGGAYKNGTLEGGRIDFSGDEKREHQYPNGTWYGVDECLQVYANAETSELYWDDELREDLTNVTYGQMTILLQACAYASVNETCFSGGFIDDLNGTNRVIITASNETYYSWTDTDIDRISDFSAGFFDALYGYDTYYNANEEFQTVWDNPINADYNNDTNVSMQEAFKWALDHDNARWIVRTQNGTIPDPFDEYEASINKTVDESPWMDDDGDGLPTFKAGYDIFLLGDFNFDGKVDVADVDLFITAYFSGEYDPLYDLDDDGAITGSDWWILTQCCERRVLSISASYGGTTNPSPGNHEYILGSSVNVMAIPNSQDDWKFDCWLLDGSLYYCNPITVTMDSDHDLKAYFIPSSGAAGGGQCPTLFVWNGTAYVDYGVMNIHNPTGEDVIREVPIQAEDVGISNHKALFRLREGWEGLNFSESVIDQVKLYALDNDGNRYLCSLTSAEHSSSGNVLPQLLRSDEWKVQTLLLETIDLTFVVLPHQSIQSFTFVIEGCNVIKE